MQKLLVRSRFEHAAFFEGRALKHVCNLAKHILVGRLVELAGLCLRYGFSDKLTFANAVNHDKRCSCKQGSPSFAASWVAAGARRAVQISGACKQTLLRAASRKALRLRGLPYQPYHMYYQTFCTHLTLRVYWHRKAGPGPLQGTLS